MKYPLSCDCGATLSVDGTDAGTKVPCNCGRSVEVPPLHILRRYAGQSTSSPEMEIGVRLASRDLPEGSHCAHCGKATTATVVVRVECEPPREERASDEVARMVRSDPLSWLFSWMVRKQAINLSSQPVAEDVVLELPLRMCPDCSRVVVGGQLWRSVASVPVYARLLAKHREARLTLTRTMSER